MQILETVKNIKGIQALLKKGEVFLVGGIIRDQLLGKDSKDIDLIVRKIPLNEIKTILTPFAKKDADGKPIIIEVGESFGVLKFMPNDINLEEPIDIALPRIDKKVGEGHKGIEAKSDPNLSIEQDLYRRDITINSIAINLENDKLIDPFNGLDDIKNKIIKATSTLSFSDDPLRMARSIQFAARFNFDIEEETWDMIVDNAEQIKTISGERILIELEKIFSKGDRILGINLLIRSGLHEQIFGFHKNELNNIEINTIEDFFFLIVGKSGKFMSVLKGDAKIGSNIDAMVKFSNVVFENSTRIFDILSTPVIVEDKKKAREFVVDILGKNPDLLHSSILGIWGMDEIFQEFINGKFPLSQKNLSVNGNDLIELGFKGKEIGDKLREMHLGILNEKVQNNKEDLLNFIK